MWLAYLLLLLANLAYATSYVATRWVLDDVPPATLALARVVLASGVLLAAAALRGARAPLARGDGARVLAMGVLGFAGAFAFAHWGLVRSTATNAALLIAIEPTAVIVLSPVMLGERLRGREIAGASLAVLGAVVVIVNGIPGLGRGLVPYWRGDVLLVLSALCYASYSLLGRHVLSRAGALAVTARSTCWGVAALLPLAAWEWMAGSRPAWTVSATLGTLYLALVITALAYLAWNWALERVAAPRAAVFLNVQPVAGALLGVALLGEPLTAFILAGGVLIVVGIGLTVGNHGG